jgi:hypothetical protein
VRGLLMIGLAGAAMTVAGAGAGQAQVVETTSAERRGTQQHGSNGAVAVAAPLHGSIRIDGHLDEEAWSAAMPITSFTQMEPNEGAQPTQRTEVRILIGGDALYVGARMYETDPSRIRARLARRDESVDGDVVAIYLDSRHDHLSAYYFRVTAGGAMRDAVVNERGGLDLSWDAVWDAAVTVDSLGWIAEMRIPLSQLPYTREGEGVWGLQIDRYRWNDQERSVFAYTPRTETQGPPRYGHLRGLGELPAPTRIELVPYVTARGEHLAVADDNPFRSGRDLFANAGVDLRYRVTPGLTLNATVNPDFGQVEVDPAVVNLSAYETFLPERRPFFVEGRQLFTFASNRSFNTSSTPTLFFSRRIGRPPQRFVSGMQHVEAPDQSTIAAATKLTGRTGGGWSLGLLQALTLKESAEFVATDDARGSLPVEPMTNYLVGRVRREMAGGSTVVGGFTSGVHRDLNDDVLTDLLRRSAYVGGVDLNHSWDNRRWALDAALAMSRVEGSESAMSLTQRSSARYFQRPDASSFSFDPGQTSLQGHYGQLSLARTSGEHWLGSVTYQETSPGFEVNDLGFQAHADRRAFSTAVGRQETRPNSWSRNHVFAVFTNHSWNHDGDALSANYSVLAEVSMLNFWRFELRGTYIDEVFNDRLTRGGPLTLRPRGFEAGINVSSDPRNPVQGFFWSNYSRNDAGAARTSAGLSLSYQPSPTVRLMLEPNLTIDHNPAQYVFAAGDPLMSATYDRRYIFADLEQRELALVTRVDWTFSPRMSLQVFLQPLVASGAFSGFKELAAPRTFDFNEYGVDVGTIDRTNGVYTIDPDGDAGTDNALVFGDPDFNFRSLRGNAVLRWEYRPGSTLFFVWQQRRSGSESFGDFNFGRDYGAIFSAKPENVFAIKATYWITR